MWHIRRIHLEAIGHEDARFDPLTLEFVDARDNPTDSVLWLENTGGKTSWVSLVLSVLRPDRKEFLGSLRDEKRLEHYVLGPDTAHVVIEWQRLGPPSLVPLETPRLVTGQVLQWKDRRVDLENATRRLQRRLYGFVAGDGLDFDRLPFHLPSGQRRALPDFVDNLSRALEGADAQRPTENHSDWHMWLERHGLDPEVFRYQVLMNADEGAVAEQFKWANGNAFVRWALPYVIDPAVPEEISIAVEGVRGLIGRQDVLDRERIFCTRMAEALERTAMAQAVYVETTTALGTAFDEAALLAACLKAGEAKAQDLAATAKMLAETFTSQAQEASTLAHLRGRQRAEALLVGAELKVKEIAADLDRALAQHTRQRITVDAWNAVPLVVEMKELELALTQTRLEVEAHRTDTQPLREAEAATAAMLARRLTDLRDRAVGERDASQALVIDFESAEARARAAVHAAEIEQNSAIAAESIAAGRLSALDEQMVAAVEDGLLRHGEGAADGASRWHGEMEEQAAVAEKFRQRYEQASRQTNVVWDSAASAEVALSRAQTLHDAAMERHHELVAAEAQIRVEPVLIETAQQVPFDPWHAPAVVFERLAETSRAAMAACVRVEVEAGDDRRAALHLSQEHLLPPSTDVERALAALEAADIHTAWSGWQVLRDRYQREDRAHLIETHPELANGVLLGDGTDLDQAYEVIKAVRLGLPLVVASMGTLESDAQTSKRFVIPGPAALHDEEAAQEELGLRTERLAEVEATLELHHTTEQTAREVAARYRAFLDRWPRETRDQTHGEVVRSREARDIAVNALADAEAQKAIAVAANTCAAEERKKEEARLGDLRVLAERARDLARRVESRHVFERERQTAAGRRALAESARERARQDERRQRAATATARAGVVEAEGRRREAANQLDRHGLGPTNDGPVPSEPPDLLERAWRQASAALERVRRDDVLLAEEQHLSKKLGRLQGDLDATVPEARAEAERLLVWSTGLGAADRTAERQAAMETLGIVDREVGALRNKLDAARQVREDRERPQKDRSRLEVYPATAALADELAEALQVQQTLFNSDAGSLEKQRDEHTTRAQNETAAATRLGVAATNLGNSLKLYADVAERSWPLPPVAAATWVGTVADGEGRSSTANHQLAQLAQERNNAVAGRQVALVEVNGIANEPPFASLVVGPLRDRLLRDPDSARAVGASALARELMQRARSIERDLAQIGEHRGKISLILVGQVKSAILLLQQLQSQSRLPEGLDEWSGRHFLTVRYPDLPQDLKQLAGRVATVVDRACDPAIRQKIDGLTLLYDGLRAAVSGDFTVEILKPGKMLRHRRVPVAEILKFSGGQKVTAAIVLFAALTRLREMNLQRDHLKRADIGATLILDNPIGKASAKELIEVQRRVAERCRLQLIYTTGVYDLGALGLFTCIVRLDAKENLRTGALHAVEVERTVGGVRLIQRRSPTEVRA